MQHPAYSQAARNGKAQKLNWLCALLSLLALLPLTAQAGNGNFKQGKYNFCVSVRFRATTEQLARIRASFERGGQVFADATDGQQSFGTITIVNDSGASQAAEFWVNAGPGRAYATYGKYGVRGEHVNLFFDSNFLGTEADSYTIAHELAHHSFGLADEYSGRTMNGSTIDNGADCSVRPEPLSLSFCLMDNYRIRGGRQVNNGAYTLNEFCVQGNHDPDHNTFQQLINGESCWETIAKHLKRKATAPQSLPVDLPPVLPIVSFNTPTATGLRVMLVIDRSGSMSIDNRLMLAQQAAKLFTNFLRPGDSVGLASFDCDTTTNFPLTTITDDSVKTALKSAIDTLSPGGATNIGGGLLQGLAQLQAQQDRSCNEVIVLLTDGEHNCGTEPGATVSTLQSEGVTVFNVGLGADISDVGSAVLQSVASQTGGKYLSAPDSFSLLGVFVQLLLESRVKSNGLLQRTPLSMQANQTREVMVNVEAGATSALFGVALANAADQLALRLRTPAGTLLDASSASQSIQYFSEPNSRAFQVANPQAGLWTLMVSSQGISDGRVETFAAAENDGTQLCVSARKDILKSTEMTEIQASPTFAGQRVTGVSVTGMVSRPGGTRLPIQLFDDGNPQNGDGVANDGIYSARFNAYTGNGTYTFELATTTNGGMTFGGEGLFDDVPTNTKPVPVFTRISNATVVVSDAAQGVDISLTQSATPANVVVNTGTNLTYTLNVTNNGNDPAVGVTVSDTLPNGVSFVSCTASNGGVCGGSGNARTVTFASLAAGSTATITFTVTVNCVGVTNPTLDNTASVSQNGTDPNLSNNVATVTVAAAPGQLRVTSESGGTSLEFGPVAAARETLANPPSRVITLENSGCQQVTVNFGFRRNGPEVSSGKVSDPDDSAVFQIRAVNADGSETPVTSAQINGGQPRRFRVIFNPLIPATAGRVTNLFAHQVIPDVVNSLLTITPVASTTALEVPLTGRVTTEVKLINPLVPRTPPLVVLAKTNADEFSVEFSTHDANLDIYYATYQFLNVADVPIGEAPGFDLTAEIAAQNVVKGQSFTVVKRFSGASRLPEVNKVRVTLYDRQGNVSAVSQAIGTQAGRIVNVSAASFAATALAPGSIVAAFGERLATRALTATTTPLPLALGGTQVFVTDSRMVERAAPLFFVAPGQVNYQLPLGTAPGTATVTIAAPDGTVARETINVTNVAPALFTANANGQGVPVGVLLRVRNGVQSYEAIANFDNTTRRYVAAPIDLGGPNDEVYLILFGSGWRNRTASGVVVARATTPNAPTAVNVDLPVLFAGPQGGLVGVDQVNLRLPRALAGRGEMELALMMDGRTANPVRVLLR